MGSPTIDIVIENELQIRLAFNRAPELMQPALVTAVNKSLLTIGKEASKNSPVRTGNLRSSILDPNRGLQLASVGVIQGSVGSGTNYGLYVELGTRFMRAQPFLRPAVDSTHEVVQGFFKDAVQGVLDIIAGETRL